jgi:hypothetical protein
VPHAITPTLSWFSPFAIPSVGALTAGLLVAVFIYKSADLRVLVTRGRLQTDGGSLSDRARQWIEGIKSQFAGIPVQPADTAPITAGLKG